MRLLIETIKAAAARRPEGYVDDVMSRGVVDGDWLEMSDQNYFDLRSKYAPGASRDHVLPGLPRMVIDAVMAAKGEVAAVALGKPRVTDDEATARMVVCRGCQ